MSDRTPPNGFRTFLIVWATQSVSVIGSALTLFASTIWLSDGLYPRPEQKTELSLALAGLSLAFAVPTVFVAPIAGAWADRHDRKRTMFAVNLVSAASSVILTGLLVTHTLNLWLLIGLMALFSTLGAFHGAAFDTSYAMIVPDHQLPRANGMMQTMFSLSGMFAPGIAAALIALPALARQGALPGLLASPLASLSEGTALAILVDSITFLGAALVLPLLNIPSPRRAELANTQGTNPPSMLTDLRQGAMFVWHRRPLLWLLGAFTVANFTGAPQRVLLPLVVKFDLVADWTSRGLTFEATLALLATLGGIGGVVGGLAISGWGGLRRRRVYGVLVPMILGGLAQISFGFSHLLYLSAAMLLVNNAMVPVLNAHSQAIWQTQTPRELQGRVFAVRRVIAQFTWPLSTAMTGIAGGFADPGLVLVALGGIGATFCVAQLFNPYLRGVEDRVWLDKLAARRSTVATT